MKRRTSGKVWGKVLYQVEQTILDAAGIEVAVEDLKNVKSFWSNLQRNWVEDLYPPISLNKNVAHGTSQKSHGLFLEDEEDIRIDISSISDFFPYEIDIFIRIGKSRMEEKICFQFSFFL